MLKDETFLICHWSALTDRRAYLEEQFSLIGVVPVFIENYDRRIVSDEELARKFNATNIAARPERNKLIGWVQPYVHMTKGFICNFLNHVSAYQYILDHDLDRAILFEDDCIFEPNMATIMDDALNALPKWADMAFIGDTQCIQPHTQHQKLLAETASRYYELPDPKTCDAYIVTKKAAELLVKDLDMFGTPIDVELTYPIKKHNLRVAHLMPPTPIIQGSNRGHYPSYR